ncbi:PPOX class F420-dependent oxidoreductase [Nocardioides zeae]|uniref:PPOX class F420-dependent oxidoreductase n=1 Tax=Nocardioides imazamoxiresistens TaxID=3231893 RepID=A0ABU3Q0L1_9ACTN|nr:PPOX class F420-dependent oxidoreductase [Nocardioides zeae]MDT9594976.1 PPOX class F420-dependent oxidoreductase [Nocardioides zeae]
MPEMPFPDDLRALLHKPNPAVVATLRKDGAPVSVATWYLLEDDDRILLSMDSTRVRLQHLRRDPRLSLTVLDEASWYVHVSVVGRAVELRDDEGLEDINRISRHYRGQDYPDQESPRVTAVLEVDRWHGWNSGKGVSGERVGD